MRRRIDHGCVAELLKAFGDVMPYKLPHKLPSRREIDHNIKLLPGAKPHAHAPYRMVLLDFAELRKQLNEMLKAGFI